MALTRAARMSADALCQAIRDQYRAEPPVILQPEPVLYDEAEVSAGQQAAWDAYARVGWLDKRGRIAGHVLDTLSVLAHPRVEYYGLFQLRGVMTAVVVAVGEFESVLAYRRNDRVLIDSLHTNESPTHALVRELPDHLPARLDAVNVRLADLDPHTHHQDDRCARDDTRKLRALSKQPTVGGGELWVAVRAAGSVRRVCETPVRYLDLRSGRILVITADGYVSIAPATKEVLRTRVVEMYRTLSDP